MAYDKGKLIRPFDEAAGPSTLYVTSDGIRRSVEIHHVSREALNDDPSGPRGGSALRIKRRARRKRHMRLRKLRGWR